jgi:hypothetical protein
MLPHERRRVDQWFRRLGARALIAFAIVAVLNMVITIINSIREREEQLHGRHGHQAGEP